MLRIYTCGTLVSGAALRHDERVTKRAFIRRGNQCPDSVPGERHLHNRIMVESPTFDHDRIGDFSFSYLELKESWQEGK
ncbi:MAG: hypothetical protein V1894_00765 [Chloroflexota bacterium]